MFDRTAGRKASVVGTIINSFTVIALAVGLGLTYQANLQAADTVAPPARAAIARGRQ